MKHVRLFAVSALIAALVVALVVTNLPTDSAPAAPDRYHGGTAHQWFRQTQDWQAIQHKEKKIATKYRRLNDRLLKVCPQ